MNAIARLIFFLKGQGPAMYGTLTAAFTFGTAIINQLTKKSRLARRRRKKGDLMESKQNQIDNVHAPEPQNRELGKEAPLTDSMQAAVMKEQANQGDMNSDFGFIPSSGSDMPVESGLPRKLRLDEQAADVGVEKTKQALVGIHEFILFVIDNKKSGMLGMGKEFVTRILMDNAFRAKFEDMIKAFESVPNEVTHIDFKEAFDLGQFEYEQIKTLIEAVKASNAQESVGAGFGQEHSDSIPNSKSE